jgi:hypothetical protein
MSPVREALVLPGLFLTVALLGGVRIGPDAIRLVPPPVIALVLALLLVAVFVRSGVLAGARLVGPSRTAIENVSGGVVILALGAASAQAFNLVIPDRGLLHVIFGTFFFVQLLTTLAGVRDRRACLRSLAVLLGAAFVLRFLVLDAAYAPDGGTLSRVLTALAEGMTLGSLQYEPNGAATGYVAFVALTLYLVGLVLLPADDAGLVPRLPGAAGPALPAAPEPR